MSPRAVVFGYHDVGDRCLRALVSEGWDVPLVVTHEADPTENAWFADVGATAAEYAIPVLRPANAEAAGIERTLHQLRPDFIFSFYYRSLIGEGVLGCARRAALNMHGSLLPNYRGGLYPSSDPTGSIFGAATPVVGTIADAYHVAFTGFPAGYVIPLGTSYWVKLVETALPA